MAVGLGERLTAMGVDVAQGFEDYFTDAMDRLYNYGLWGVSYILQGGYSDDHFEYFRCWVISQGREMTDKALADPEGFEVLVDPGAGHEYDVRLECEPLLYVGMLALKALTGECPARKLPHPREPMGERWEEEDLDVRFPGLMASRH
jgi:hypothetical protein